MNIMEPVLSIGITSYNRVNELERCIRSINTSFVDDIEVIVSEDCSPLSEEIGKKVKEIERDVRFRLTFIPNEHNLGYDGNLGAIFKKCKGEYVFLMSDDDTFYEGFFDILISFLKSGNNKGYGVIYSPFAYPSNNKLNRNHGKEMAIEKGEDSCKQYIYDSILFSGLIFHREKASVYDASKFLNMNFFQVYLFLKMLFHHGGYYFSHPSVWCVADGENAYGISESSGGNKILANRKSVISNLEFHKTLIKVIRLFDEEEKTKVFDAFEKQYSLHAYTGLSMARQCGRTYFNNYWNTLKSLDLRLYPVTKLYYLLLSVFGAKISDIITKLPKKILKK